MTVKCLPSNSSVVILDPFNVCFHRHRATLHFHDLQRLAGIEIFKAMQRFFRDISALILAEDQDVPAIHDLGPAADHDPMLASELMSLKAEPLSRKDFHELDLEVFAVIDHGVKTPGAANTFFLHISDSVLNGSKAIANLSSF